MNYYTVYDKKTDEIIASGNARECANQMHRSVESFYCTVSRNRRGIYSKYVVVVEDAYNSED